jgi:hypothetical protein
MSALQAFRLRDRTSAAGGVAPSIDLTPLLGSWVNTETRSPWLATIHVRAEGPRLRIHPLGGSDPSPADWGEREADVVCTTAIDSSEGGGYVATFAMDSMDSELQATLNQGLLVVVAFNRMHDGANAPGRVAREFFHRVGAGA